MHTTLIKDMVVFFCIYHISLFVKQQQQQCGNHGDRCISCRENPQIIIQQSEGYKAANQLLKMSPAGITVSHICLLTVFNLCLYFAQQILLSEQNFNVLNFWKSFCGQGHIRLLDKQGDVSSWWEHVKQSNFIGTKGNLLGDSDSLDYRETMR